ncbi:MAG: heme lyase CcmF/NrfE family subunit [Anaerolineales bacterium]
MLADIGIIALFLAFLASVAGTGLALWSTRRPDERLLRSARNAFVLTLPLLGLVAILLIVAQVSGHYHIAYVNNVSKDAQPLLLKITALWGGQSGSLILWSFMLSGFTVAALWLNWRTERHLMPWMMVVSGVTLTFFLVLNNFYENPFARYWSLPDGNIEIALVAPSESLPAYPYQSEEHGEFFHTAQHETFAGAPDARLDGRGLNPLLRHPGMIIHPPMLYLGFTGFMIPFAFAMAALLKGDFSNLWISATRRWSVIAWMFLSIGIILGGRWAYDVLGWGGYWGWDPVENSSLLPWLTGTAFLHSVMIQERRGMLKGWNMFMIILTYILMLFGTVATRTGLLSSVHTFAQSPLALPMGGFLAATALVCVGVFVWRGSQGAFRNDHRIESLFSRESLFLFNNWIFLALTVVIFWGTWAELITGMLQDAGFVANTINLGPEYYEMITPWLFGVLFVLMGVAPLAAWRKASAARVGRAIRVPTALTALLVIGLLAWGVDALVVLSIGLVAFAGFATLTELYKGAAARHKTHAEPFTLAFGRLFARDRRRYGGYTIHLGVVIIGIGIIGSTAFQEIRQRTLAPGEFIEIGPYLVQYDEAYNARAIDGRDMFIANVSLWRDGEYVTQLRPRRDIFEGDSMPMTIAGTHSTVENDVYALITFWEDDRITFRVYLNPLVALVWWGGALFVVGTVIAVYPQPEKRRKAARAPEPHLNRAQAAAGD